MQWGDSPILTLGLRFLPYIRSRNQGHLVSKMELHQDFVCFDEIFGFLGRRNHHLSYVASKFILCQSDNLHIPQGSQFLENCTLHVCSCIERVHVRKPQFCGEKRAKELFLEMRLISSGCIWTGYRRRWVSIKHNRRPICSYAVFPKL